MRELVAALRGAGLNIGVDEELRLLVALSAALPEVVRAGEADLSAADPELLRDLLRAVVVKSPAQGKTFDEVFAAWLTARERHHPPPPSAAPGPRGMPVRPAARRWPVLLWLAAVTVVMLGTAGLLYLKFRHRPPPPKPAVVTAPAPPQTEDKPAGGPPLHYDVPQTYTALVPDIQVSGPPANRALWGGLLLFISSALLGLGLWALLRRRGALPEAAPAPRPLGLPRVLPRVAEPPSVLLDRRQEEALVWGIGRFMAEEAGRRLDVRATIRATATAGGWLTPVLQRARHSREVWLWLDESMGEAEWAEGQRLADEIERALSRAGLRVEVARFEEVPERLRGEHGPFQPGDVEDRRDGALLALFTDGRWLIERLCSARDRGPAAALLRALSGWPRLAFVDMSRGARGLQAVLAKHGLLAILPEEAPAFLGTGAVPRGGPRADRPGDARGELRAWAAACAVSCHEVSEPEALRLREGLSLEVPAAGLRWLRQIDGGPAGRFRFSPEVRAELLRWLLETEGAAPDGMLGKAIGVHQAHLREEEKQRLLREAADPEEAWQDTPAQRHLYMESELLRLWLAPEESARGLYRLYRGDELAAPAGEGALVQAIRRELGALAPRECAALPGATERAVLPWEIGKLSAPAQHVLLRMGLSGGLLRGREGLHLPGRGWLGLGLCAGLAAAAGVAMVHHRRQPAGEPAVTEVYDNGVPKGRSWTRTVPTGHGTYRVLAWTPQQVSSATVRAGSKVSVRWSGRTAGCRVPGPEMTERWTCGDVDPARLSPLRRRSVAAVLAPATDPSAQELSSRLLDSGSAGVVLLGDRALRGLEKEPLGEDGQVIVVIPKPELAVTARWQHSVVVQAEDFVALADGLHFPGPDRSVQAVWGPRLGARNIAGDGGAVLVRGQCPELEGWAGDMKLVRVCGGLFQMGDRMPPVRVSQFWIGKYEVSNREYEKIDKAHNGRFSEKKDLPVETVSWDEARGFCHKLGMQLPTEPEWEFAARGVDGRKYPWGNEEPSPARAVYGRRFEEGPESAAGHPDGKGPFGALNQAGNVWEWVEDCNGDERKNDNPVVRNCQVDRDIGEVRVLRGGSYRNGPGLLRSAFRDWIQPANRNWGFGFRCVRGSRRQP